MSSVEFGSLGWVDWALLGVLVLSMVVGLWRGVVFELLSLAGWVAAFVAAQLTVPTLAPLLPLGTPGGALNHALAFALAFVGALLAWAIGSKLVRLLVHASPLQPVDRAFGALFGAVRGLVVLLAVAIVVLLTPAQRSLAWQDSQGAAWLAALVQGVKPMLPEFVGRHLPA